MQRRTGATPDLVPTVGTLLGPGVAASRDAVLRPLLDQLSEVAVRSVTAPEALSGRAADEVVPDPELRPLLLADAALAALLPGFRGSLELDGGAAVFRVGPDAAIGLAPHLTGSPDALVAAARWAIELTDLEETAPAARRGRAVLALEHGVALARGLDGAAWRALAAALPAVLHESLATGPDARTAAEPSAAVRGLLELVTAPWAVALAAELDAGPARAAIAGALELALPLERILVAGGDTRLRVDPAHGLNRYGTAPRPRPEAVHFSSSTA